MSIELSETGVEDLSATVRVLREWQQDGAPVQLHPGDLGWQWRFGAAATAAAVRTWSRAGEALAIGMVDSPGLLRLAVAPEADHDEELARQVIADVTQAERGVLTHKDVAIEARFGAALHQLLLDDGWQADEPWTPLQRDLSESVEDCGMRVEVVGPDRVSARTAVQRAAFENSTFTDERWQAMAAGPAYADARCLVAYDAQDAAVAAATVWSAGPGRPGLIEPLGVHRDHRGHGYGRAMTIASAAALRDMGSSTATVCTPSANVGAVATYASAGFEEQPAVRDLRRSS